MCTSLNIDRLHNVGLAEHHVEKGLIGFQVLFNSSDQLRERKHANHAYGIRSILKATVQRDLRGSKVVLIDRSPFKLPTLRSGF